MNINLIPGVNVTPELTNKILSKNDYLESDSRLRFSSAPWAKEMGNSSISILGLGGIGSYVAYFISRLGPSVLYIQDFDTVEGVNMAGQMFSISDVGYFKTNAVSALINRYSPGVEIVKINKKVEEGFMPESPIVITGFDNMEARKTSYVGWKSYIKKAVNSAEEEGLTQEVNDIKKKALFIDGRLAAETLQMIVIRGDQEDLMKEYEDKYLFSSEEALDLVCSYKQTSHIAGMLGSLITSTVVNFITNNASGFDFSPINFFTEFDAQTMNFKIL